MIPPKVLVDVQRGLFWRQHTSRLILNDDPLPARACYGASHFAFVLLPGIFLHERDLVRYQRTLEVLERWGCARHRWRANLSHHVLNGGQDEGQWAPSNTSLRKVMASYKSRCSPMIQNLTTRASARLSSESDL